MRRPVPIAIGAATLLLVLGIPFTGLKLASFSPQSLPASASSRQVDETIEREFATDLNPSAYAVVRAPADAGDSLDAYAERLRALPDRPEVAAPELVGRDTWRVDVAPRAHGDDPDQLVSGMRAARSDFPVLVGGQSASLVDQKSSLIANLPIALAILVGATLIVLFLMTRSVLLPLKAIVLNLLTICAVFGVLVWIFQDGRLEGLLDYRSQGGIEPTLPIMIAAIAFALSTDYGVLLLGRIKEARDSGDDNRTAVAHGLERTGRIVSGAALLFIVAIGAFSASHIVSIKMVGLGVGLAVLIDATIVRALLVPSLMVLFGRWNWWAPRLRPAYARVRR
jgi:RND superfamily putative drug exporter